MIEKQWNKFSGYSTLDVEKTLDIIIDRLNEMEPQEEKPQEEMVEVTISDGKGSYVANNKIVFLKVRYSKAKLLAALNSIKL